MDGRWLSVVGLAATLIVAGCGADDDPGPTPTGDRALGQLSARWWGWVFRQPVEADPMADQTGRHCRLGQPADVFFLANTYGRSVRRSCTVPAGRRLFVPVVVRVCQTTPAAQERDVARCAPYARRATASASIDGRRLRPVYAVSRLFRYGSSRRAVVVGRHVLLGGLQPGAHRLRFSVGRADSQQDVTYLLRAVRER